MYLYKKNNNKIIIYNLIPNNKKIYEYRLEQMKQIPEENRIIRGVTGMGIERYEIFKNYENKFNNEIIPIENANGQYHILEPTHLNSKDKEKLLKSYYNGDLKDKKIARLWDKKIRYFLLNQLQYRYYFEKVVLEEIIEIPESLYLLSLIEQELFSLIENKDIKEQLSLFNLEQIQKMDLETIERIDYIGIAPGCYSKTIQKIENDTHILKLLKK